jgi:hypothetical protein
LKKNSSLNNMLIKFSLIFLLQALISQNKIESKSPDTSNLSYCLVKNVEYQDEYMYSCRDVDFSDSYKRKVFTNKMSINYMKSFDQMGWIFQPVEGLNNTFYITNAQYHEHLCATHNHLEIFNYRRKVNLNRLNKHSLKTNKKCMWKLDLVDEPLTFSGHLNKKNNFFFSKNMSLNKTATNPAQDTKLYTIWNINYREPLYAASYLLKAAKSKRRNIYTWHTKPDSRQFYWYIHCF